MTDITRMADIMFAQIGRRGEPVKDVPYFSMGCKLLDLITGGAKGVYGVPAGRVINVVGDKSSGKTFLCNEIIASAYHRYGDKFRWMYDDCESGYSFNTEEMYGINIVTPDSNQSSTVEQAFYNIKKFCDTIDGDEFGVYVLDSLDALTSDEQDSRADARVKAYDSGKEFDKGTYGMGKPKYLSQEFFPQLVRLLESKNILLVIVSQIRDNVDMFSFEKYTRGGGKALDFYCYMIIWLATAKKLMKKEHSVGGTNRLKVTKGKVSRPFRDGFYTYYYDYGIDDTGTCLDYLYDLRTGTGDLSAPLAKNIAWEKDDSKKPITAPAIREFLKANKSYDKYLASTICGNSTFDTVSAQQFIASVPELSKLYSETFAAVMDRETLINYIEDRGLQDELYRRVEEKWEAVEDAIRTTRVKKYGTQLPSGE